MDLMGSLNPRLNVSGNMNQQQQLTGELNLKLQLGGQLNYAGTLAPFIAPNEEGDMVWHVYDAARKAYVPTEYKAQGPRGEIGPGFAIKGYFNNLNELQNAVPVPAPGDVYGIGIAAPYDIYVWDDINRAWVNNGAIQGPEGPKGDTGAGLVILGHYTSLDALLHAVTDPAPGDAYNIGTSYPYDTYVFDGTTGNWINNGPLQGPTGPQGENGYTFIPYVSTDGELSWTNNGGLQNPPALNIKGPQGLQGEDGYSPERGKDYWTAADQTAIVNDVLTALPTWNGGSY